MIDQVAKGGLQDVLLAAQQGGKPVGAMPSQVSPILDGLQAPPVSSSGALPQSQLVTLLSGLLGQVPALPNRPQDITQQVLGLPNATS